MKIYDFILQGAEATLDNAIDAANGIDWQSEKCQDWSQTIYHDYVDTVNGVDIWYEIPSDSYLFTTKTNEYA